MEKKKKREKIISEKEILYAFLDRQEQIKSRLRDLEEFFEKERRLPRGYIESERSLYYFMTAHKKDSRLSHLFEAEKIIEAGWRRHKFETDFQELLKHYYTYGKLPNEGKLFRFINVGIAEGNYKIINFIDQVESRKRRGIDGTFEMKLRDLIDFCERNKRLPQISDKEEISIRKFMRKFKDNPEVSKIINTYEKKKKSFEDMLSDAQEYYELNGRLPKMTENYGLYRFILQNRFNPKVKEIINTYSKKKCRRLCGDLYRENLLGDFQKFLKDNNRLPNYKDRSNLWWFYSINKYHPKVIELTLELESRINNNDDDDADTRFEENFDNFVKYCYSHNRLPKVEDSSELYKFINDHIDNVEVMSVVNEFKGTKEYYIYM